jgi:hypothetical protein
VSGHLPSWPPQDITAPVGWPHEAGEAAVWVGYELQFVRREAQAEADLAYQAWCREPGGDGYVVYRAAQDRADAAEDDLAAWTRAGGVDGGAGRPWR